MSTKSLPLKLFCALLLITGIGAACAPTSDETAEASPEVQKQAQVMKEQGWVYVMPRPKSAKARWGNPDGRTTWWLGYWRNSKTRDYSRTTPTLDDEGQYTGDGVNDSGKWRRGGSPDPNSFTELQLLMSDPKTHPPSRRSD